MLSRSLRFAHAWLLGLLPAAGAVVGIVYSRFGRTVEGGNDLIVDEIHKPGGGIPLRMAPLVLVGTLVTHLFFVRAALRNTLAMLFGLPNALNTTKPGLGSRAGIKHHRTSAAATGIDPPATGSQMEIGIHQTATAIIQPRLLPE